jgi:hypothetical protein
MKVTRLFGPTLATLLLATYSVCGQTGTTSEQRVPMDSPAVAFDAAGTAALESTLKTAGLTGAPDTPVTNVRMVIRNVSPEFFGYVSGVVSFYDSAGVRCGEGLFKADVLAPGESVETDAPGIRIRCSASTWRIVATHLVPRTPLGTVVRSDSSVLGQRLMITVDGEEHPIQLEKPIVLTLGTTQRTIVVRQAP